MTLKISFAKTPRAASETAVILVFEKNRPDTAVKALSKATQGLVTQTLKNHRAFKAKNGQVLSLTPGKGEKFRFVMLLGAGSPEKLDARACEKLGKELFAALKDAGAERVTLFAGAGKEGAASLALGMKLASYSFDKYKSENKGQDKSSVVREIDLILDGHKAAAKLYKGHSATAEGIFLAHDLANEPPNTLYPASYAKIIRKELGPLGIKIEVLDAGKMKQLGFGAHLAVGQGSERPPCVVVMRWNGVGTGKGKKAALPLAFVGKGITFDSGGLSIKSGEGMTNMKKDMGGSAGIVGLMKTLALRKAKANVVAVVALAENMPSHNAYRPDDIIKSLSGKTIEIQNTDAEGRLVLADALTYVQRKYKPRFVIDMATLTGAIVVALGYEYYGAFVNDEKLWNQIEKASQDTGEKFWRMPLDESYRKEVESKIADLKNMGGSRWGGACSAAGFLEHFIEKGQVWAHLDIAAEALRGSDKAGTYGVRVLNRLVADHYES